MAIPTVALIEMLKEIRDNEQEFYIKVLNEDENQITYRYKLQTFYSDGHNHWLRLKGRYVRNGYQEIRGVVPDDECLVNLKTIIYIKPIPKNNVRPIA